MPRYTVSGIPPVMAQLGMSAFMPHFNRLAGSGAQAYKGAVTGRPGTAAVPIGGIGPPSPDVGDLILDGPHSSRMQPDAIWPNQYWVGTDPVNDRGGGTAQVQIYDTTRPQDTTMIPVPAVNLQGVYQAHSAKLAGGIDNQRMAALKQATNFLRWPRRKSGNGSDQ